MKHLIDMTDIRAACAAEETDADESVIVSIGMLRSMLDDMMKVNGRLGALRNACVAHEKDATSIRKLADQFCERSARLPPTIVIAGAGASDRGKS